MAKKNLIPMLKTETMFELLQNSHRLRMLEEFKTGGSIPPSLNWGDVTRHPDLYEWVDNPVITGHLKFVSLEDVTYVGPGVIMANIETGARYFMLSKEFAAMMDQCVSDHNVITGTWSVFKHGHAFSLRHMNNMNTL
jgi:hypothetical protein